MKKRFKYLALREAKNTGAFGHYLTMPVTDKTRTLIIGIYFKLHEKFFLHR